MATRKRTKVQQNTAKQIPVKTPKLQNNTKDRLVLVDKTNQIVTVRALRNRKVYRDQNTDTLVSVSKKLFTNRISQSPRPPSKKKTSTKKPTVPQKSSKCFVPEKVDKTIDLKDVVCKDRNSSSAEKQTLTKVTLPQKSSKRFDIEKVDKTSEHKNVACKDRNSSSAEKQTLTKKLGKVVRKGNKCPVVPEKIEDKVKKDIRPPNADKQITTEGLRNVPQKSRCSAVPERIVEAKDQKKLVYNDISPPSAEKQKGCTPEKKIMLYDFKGGSGSSDNSSRKPARKRKPVRKRMKPQSDMSDEENCDVHNVTKKMKLLAACSQENQNDCTNLHSQTIAPSMNSSVQLLREQNTLPNQSVRSETRKFFKTPMRKQLVEMSLFNYTNQKKRKFPKSSKTLNKKKENSKSCRKKENLLFCKSTQNNIDTSKKLPLKPVMLNENNMQSKLGNIASLGNSKIPVLVKPTASNNTITVPVKSVVTNVVDPSTKLGLGPQTVIADKTEMARCAERVMDVEVCAAKDLSAEETSTKERVTVSQINYKRGGTRFGLDFTLGESEADCSKQTDNTVGEAERDCSKQASKCVAVNQVQTTLPAISAVVPATAAPPVAVTKEMQVVKDKTENKTYFTGPVRSFRFLEKYNRNTRRHRVEALYIPAVPSTEHFTLENYFGFDEEEPEEELILSPLKRPCDTNIPALPLTSTPHIANAKLLPPPNRLIVKPKLKEYQRKANESISTNQNNCSQILARGGCGFKNKSSVLGSLNAVTFAVPQIRNISVSTAKKKQPLVGVARSMVQSSITDYMQNDREVSCISDIPFDTSLSNIEADELSVTHTQPPRRSYERLVRNRRHYEDEDYVSETEEEKPQLSKKGSRSKRAKRSKKQERMFEKWASNVSSQFDEIDSVALIVE